LRLCTRARTTRVRAANAARDAALASPRLPDDHPSRREGEARHGRTPGAPRTTGTALADGHVPEGTAAAIMGHSTEVFHRNYVTPTGTPSSATRPVRPPQRRAGREPGSTAVARGRKRAPGDSALTHKVLCLRGFPVKRTMGLEPTTPGLGNPRADLPGRHSSAPRTDAAPQASLLNSRRRPSLVFPISLRRSASWSSPTGRRPS
jgi:hypothetical protein